MVTNLTDAIVKITSAAPNNSNFGTGFVIYRDECGDYLLTCQHVVEAVGDAMVLADGVEAQLIADGFDLAIVRVEPPLSRQPLRLRVAHILCGQFVTRGHYHLTTQSGAAIRLSGYRCRTG